MSESAKQWYNRVANAINNGDTKELESIKKETGLSYLELRSAATDYYNNEQRKKDEYNSFEWMNRGKIPVAPQYKTKPIESNHKPLTVEDCYKNYYGN